MSVVTQSAKGLHIFGYISSCVFMKVINRMPMEVSEVQLGNFRQTVSEKLQITQLGLPTLPFGQHPVAMNRSAQINTSYLLRGGVVFAIVHTI